MESNEQVSSSKWEKKSSSVTERIGFHPSHLGNLIHLPWGFHHRYQIRVISMVFGLMSILKITSVSSEPLSAIHFSRIFSLQLFLWPFSCPLTPVLNQLFVIFPRQYQIALYGTLLPSPKSSILSSWSLKCPAHVARFDCYFINTFQFCCPPRGGGALPIVEYTERLRPKRVTFWACSIVKGCKNRYLSILNILKVSKVRC